MARYKLWLLCVFVGVFLTGAKARPLSPAHQARYERVQACLGLYASPPKIVWKSTVACPTSGRLSCIAGVKPFPCPWDTSVRCGISGSYKRGKITLPDLDDSAFEHEAIHHIFKKNGYGVDRHHVRPGWACEIGGVP